MNVEYRKCKTCKKDFRGYKQNGIWKSSLCPECRKAKDQEKREKKKTTKKYQVKEIRTLEKKAWKVFSKAIRERHITFQDYVECYTCRRLRPLKSIDAGHFKHRGNARYKAIDFHPDHIHAQCKECNGFKDGMNYEFGKRLEEDYGEEWVKKITRRRETDLPLTKDELLEIINKYSV